MNTINNEILSAIDNIDSCVMESEMNVINALCDAYEKSSIILEHYEGEDYNCFDIFQESLLEREKGESKLITVGLLPLRILGMLIKAFQKFIKMCREKIKGFKMNKAVKNMKKEMSEEELSQFVHHFGDKHIKYENGDFIITSDIDLDKLNDSVRNFEMTGNAHMKQFYKSTEYRLEDYISRINNICKQIEDYIIPKLKKEIKDYEVLREGAKKLYIDNSIPDNKDQMDNISSKIAVSKQTLNSWNKVLSEISEELTVVTKFSDKINELISKSNQSKNSRDNNKKEQKIIYTQKDKDLLELVKLLSEVYKNTDDYLKN